MKKITIDGVEYNLTPVEQKQDLSTTIEGVCDELKPEYVIGVVSKIYTIPYEDISQLHSEAAAKKVAAYIQILNLCEYLNGKFGGDEFYIIDDDYEVSTSYITDCIYRFKSVQAAEYALKHFKPLFQQFYS